jgi:nucleotide-binding universal stress UspA family protein
MYSGLSRLGEGLPDLLQTDTPVARHIKKCAELLRSHDVDARIELRHGHPSDEILRAAEVDNYDLIVIGGSDTRGLGRLLLDEVSMQVVANSPRPVLVVRGDMEK